MKSLLRVTAGLASLGMAPVIITALRALSTAEAELLESFNWVEAFWVLLEFGSSQGFDFLHQIIKGHS